LRGEENPYRPATAPVFNGDIGGTINGQNVGTVLETLDGVVNQVSKLDSGSSAYSLVKNPLFSAYPNENGPPSNWSFDVTGSISRVAGMNSTYGVRVSAGATQQAFFSQRLGSENSPVIREGQWLILESSFKLVSGTLAGSGLMFRAHVFDNEYTDYYMNFSTDQDSTGNVVGNGSPGTTYTFTKLIQVTHHVARYLTLYAMGHYYVLGSLGQANTIDFYRAIVRQATQGEIEARTATNTIDALKATVGIYSKAISDLEGKTQAYMKIAATAGTFAESFIKLEAETGPDTNTSSLALGAQEIHLYNTGNQTYKRVMSVTNGNAEFTGGLTAGTYIRLGTGTLWNIQLQQKDFKVSDGEVVSFGVDLGNIPQVTFNYDNCSPLGTNETYAFWAENLTPTGFTARLRKITPMTPVFYQFNMEMSTGTGPSKWMSKEPNPDSTDGTYRLFFSGYITDTPMVYYEGNPYGPGYNIP